jgi:cystathionine gamma-synthase
MSSAGSSTPSLAPDLTLASVFVVRDPDHYDALHAGAEVGFTYARDGHPNSHALAARLAELEKAEAAVAVSSGMAAVSAALLTECQAGDTIVAGRELYGRTLVLLEERLRRLGIRTVLVDPADEPALVAELERRPRVLLLETLSNPLVRWGRFEDHAERCRRLGITLIVDATFTPPTMIQPLTLGADLVVHSLTKFLSGHGDVTLGSVAGSRERIAAIARNASTFGMHASAMDCWLTLRGLETLEVRWERAEANARELARRLSTHPAVTRVWHPSLAEHPDHARLAALGRGFGHMMAVEVAGGRDGVSRVFRRFERIRFAASLGHTGTTVSYPAVASHRGLSPERRAELGITDGLFRLSVGIEPIEALAADLLTALS